MRRGREVRLRFDASIQRGEMLSVLERRGDRITRAYVRYFGRDVAYGSRTVSAISLNQPLPRKHPPK